MPIIEYNSLLYYADITLWLNTKYTIKTSYCESICFFLSYILHWQVYIRERNFKVTLVYHSFYKYIYQSVYFHFKIILLNTIHVNRYDRAQVDYRYRKYVTSPETHSKPCLTVLLIDKHNFCHRILPYINVIYKTV